MSALQDGMKIGNPTYLATNATGVFLREVGKRHVCFGRDSRSRINHFNFSDTPQIFERGESEN